MDQIEAFLQAFQNIDRKELYENLLFTIGPLSTILVARFGLKAWIRYEIVVSVVIAAVIAIKPALILDIVMNSPIKKYHEFICIWNAIILVFSILYPLFLIGSEDEAVFYGHLWARIIGNTLLICENIVSYAEGVHWNYKLLCLVTSFAIANLIVSGYFLIVTKKPSGQNPFRDGVNSIAKVEFYLLLVSGLVMYAFPDKSASRLGAIDEPNESNRCLTRFVGAFTISFSIESFCVSEFIYLKDKKNFMLSRLYGSLMELTLFLSGYYYFHIYSFEVLTQMLVLNTIYNVCVFYGYIITPQEPHQKVN